MAEERVSVRLAVVGGREVRAELEGVGEAGNRGFGRLEVGDEVRFVEEPGEKGPQASTVAPLTRSRRASSI